MTEPRIVCYNTPINMRQSFEALSDLVGDHGHELDSGDVFVFFNRDRSQCKVIWHDGEGYCSIDKRLQSGSFASKENIEIGDSALRNLLAGGFLGSRQFMNALQRAVTGSNIVHISAARSAKHLR